MLNRKLNLSVRTWDYGGGILFWIFNDLKTGGERGIQRYSARGSIYAVLAGRKIVYLFPRPLVQTGALDSGGSNQPPSLSIKAFKSVSIEA